MQTIRKYRGGLWVAIVIALGLACGGLWWGLSLHLTLAPTATHERAAARWEANRPAAYQVTVRVETPLRDNAVYEVRVEGDTVTDAQRVNPGAYRFDADAPRFPVAPGQVAAYTVDGLLAQAGRVQRRLGPVHITGETGTHVRYASGYGYPQRIIKNNCGPLFGDIDACLERTEVLAFSPVDS